MKYPYLLLILLWPHFCLSQIPDRGTLNSIRNIENNIIPTDGSGIENGKPQSLVSRMQTLNIPGVSVAVFDNGNIIWAKGYGFRNKDLSYEVDTTTVFQAASISKPVTSVGMFSLVEKNQLKLDDDINSQLRSWKVPENKYTAEEKVTLRRIVSHMSGLSVHGFAGYTQKSKIPDLLQILNGVSPANSDPVRVIVKPGTKEMYSGGGFIVLQLLLQETTGKPFTELMDELVLHQAKMENSKFSLKLPESMVQNAAYGYSSDGKMVKNGYYTYPEQAAAGLWTTPSDFARFMINISNSYRGKNGILQQSTVRMMLTKVTNDGGLGFGINGEGSTLRFGHSGRNMGFSCYAVAYAESGRGVVVMTNSDNGGKLALEIAKAVIHEYNWGQ